MTPVQVDWLSVVLGPIALIALVVAVFGRRAAARTDRPTPGWTTGAQLTAVALAVFVAVINMAWGG